MFGSYAGSRGLIDISDSLISSTLVTPLAGAKSLISVTLVGSPFFLFSFLRTNPKSPEPSITPTPGKLPTVALTTGPDPAVEEAVATAFS